MASEEQKLIDATCETGTEVVNKFYRFNDKRRHEIGNLYMDTAVALWNGNLLQGNMNITKFYQDLPTSTHSISSVDCQPVSDETGMRLLISVEGIVQFEGMGPQNFSQMFIIARQLDSVWKITNDCYRHFE